MAIPYDAKKLHAEKFGEEGKHGWKWEHDAKDRGWKSEYTIGDLKATHGKGGSWWTGNSFKGWSEGSLKDPRLAIRESQLQFSI